MFSLTLVLLVAPLALGKSHQDQQIIHIRVDEELPVSTILFTTANTITYRLFDTGRNQNAFVRYEPSNGHLLLARAIDREELCAQRVCSCAQCQLTIELIEWQSPYRLLQLILNIDDINDHTPRFAANSYQFHLVENTPVGFELALEQATDADLGENSRINYELNRLDDTVSGDGPFELVMKMNGGLILKVIKEIDREERDYYEYELIAVDHGQPKRQSATKLHIKVDDTNDNAVVVADKHLRLNVSESTPVGTELARIHATDKDIGLNGKIHYSISNGVPASSWMDYFRINDSTGTLTLVGRLDYESEQSYRLTIQVRDLGENSLAQFVTVDILVIDENDNRPQAFITFVQPLANDSVIPIRENTPVGQIIAHVSISDQDGGVNGEMSYRIDHGHDLIGIRTIDQKSFLLITENSVDREAHRSHSDAFTLIIYDHGEPSKQLRLDYHLVIVDENDSPPVFDRSIDCNLQFYPADDQPLENDRPLFRVRATDMDAGENGRVSYSILAPADQFFTVDEQGQVFSTDALNQSAYFHLRIMAMDHGSPTRLNATHDCYVSTLPAKTLEPLVENETVSHAPNGSFTHDRELFPWTLALFDHYSYAIIGLFLVFLFVLLIIVTVTVTFCLHAYIFRQRKVLKPQKAYDYSRRLNLYDTVQRKSPYHNDDSGCSSKLDDQDDVTSEERERLVNLHGSDRTSSESSDSMHKQIRTLNKNSTMRPLSDHQTFSRIIRNSYPPSPYLSSMPSVVLPPPKPPRDSGYESICLLKQQATMPGRPLSLSISTATTYTSSGTDSSSSPLPPLHTFRTPYSSFKQTAPMQHVARLAEEEKIDV